MACLLHENPFQGVNGSGKHNNWSLASDTGINMLDPGVTPHENIQFLLVLACIMKAVDRHADLLRQSAAVPGNDFRLGAQEAPPAIISIFVGEQLEDVIDQLISTGSATHSKTGGTLRQVLPHFRTSIRTQPTETVPHRSRSPEISSSSVWSVPPILFHLQRCIKYHRC